MNLKNSPSLSVIVTTYNWPEALGLTLQSILKQSTRPDQVIIADDGSGPETAEVVEELVRPSGLKWCHVSQEHKGVRQSRIKNLAVSHTKYPYLIFVDQDTVLHPDFVADHLSMAQEGVFLQGKRSLLPDSYTKKILADGRFSAPSPRLNGLGNRKNTLRFPVLGRLLARPKKFHTALRGCNLSMFKSDFLKVDGFDEAYDQSWGREDSDFCYRLFHAGVQMKFLWFMALQYHLYHGSTSNWDRERLDGELEKNLEERRTKAVKGFSQLSSEGEVIAASSGF
ncbi:MAG: glycosyltransferase [Desulfobacteraceae bacterium]|jgi:GT2 family glycosyltransferase